MERISKITSFAVLMLVLFAVKLAAQNPWPDFDFKAANAEGDTLYYRITSSSAPYTVAVTRCHDSVYHTLPAPQFEWEVGQPGFLYPVYDYDSLISVPSSVAYGGQTYTVTAIDKEAFYMQKNLHTVILPASVETIDTGAFHLSTLHQIVMSPNVKSINYYAFMSTPLESVELPSGLVHIGVEAFAGTFLTQTEIPAGVSVLPYKAFYRCPMTKITFHEGLQEIEPLSVPASLIDSLVFPASLRKITLGDNSYPLSDTILCRYVQFQNGPDPLELGDNCFSGFAYLETIVLSDNITRLGKSCFEGTGVQTVDMPPLVDTIPESCFASCHNLSSITLPQQLSVIETKAFVGVPSLTEISFPASLAAVGKSAFGSGLRIINCYSEVPPSIVYNGYPSFPWQDTVYVRVPCGQTAAYQSAPGWGDYSNFVYDDCLGIDARDPVAFNVWPNPTAALLHIELSGTEIATVALYDLQGRMVTGVFDTPLRTGATATVNMRNVPAGVYVLRVTDAEGKEYLRKVVKR